MAKVVNNLYFTNGLVVHVNRTSDGKYFFANAFATPLNPSSYPYKYGIKRKVTEQIEDGGSYNVHYFHSITEMIKKVEQISKQKFMKRTYYNGGD